MIHILLPENREGQPERRMIRQRDIGHMPFPGHRNCAQVAAAPRYCSECNRKVSRVGVESCPNLYCKALVA